MSKRSPTKDSPGWLLLTFGCSGMVAVLLIILGLCGLFGTLATDCNTSYDSDCDFGYKLLTFFAFIVAALAAIIFGISFILKRTWYHTFDEEIVITADDTLVHHGRKIRDFDNRPNTLTHILLPYLDASAPVLIVILLVLGVGTGYMTLTRQDLLAVFLLAQMVLIILWLFRHPDDGVNYRVTNTQAGWLAPLVIPLAIFIQTTLWLPYDYGFQEYFDTEDISYQLILLLSLPYAQALFFAAGYMLITRVVQPYRAFSKSAILGTFIAATIIGLGMLERDIEHIDSKWDSEHTRWIHLVEGDDFNGLSVCQCNLWNTDCTCGQFEGLEKGSISNVDSLEMYWWGRLSLAYPDAMGRLSCSEQITAPIPIAIDDLMPITGTNAGQLVMLDCLPWDIRWVAFLEQEIATLTFIDDCYNCDRADQYLHWDLLTGEVAIFDESQDDVFGEEPPDTISEILTQRSEAILRWGFRYGLFSPDHRIIVTWTYDSVQVWGIPQD